MKAGVGYLVVAMALTPLADALSKSLTLEYSPFLVTFTRYFMAGFVALVLAVLLRKPVSIPQEDRLGQLVRTALLMGAMILLVYALSMVPLAKAVGGFLIAPVVASLVAVVAYREHMDVYRLTGALVSFAGAYAILRPEGSLETGTLLALAGGGMLGWYLAVTRHSGTAGSLFSTLVVQSFLGSLIIAPLAFLHGIPPLDWSLLGEALALGAVSAGCHFLTVAAYRRADASVLAPFFYFNIVFAIPIGYFWFHEMPDIATLLGLAGIAIGGMISLMSTPRQSGVFTGLMALSRNYVRRFLLKTG